MKGRRLYNPQEMNKGFTRYYTLENNPCKLLNVIFFMCAVEWEQTIYY